MYLSDNKLNLFIKLLITILPISILVGPSASILNIALISIIGATICFIHKKNYNLLSETKKLHNQKQSFSRQQLKEFSLLNIIIQFPELIDEYEEILSKLNLSSPILNEFKAVVIKDYFEKNYSKKSDFLSEENYKDLIEQIKSNTNITTIFAKKNLKEKQEILATKRALKL